MAASLKTGFAIAVLWLLVLVSALAVVYASHLSRAKVNQLSELKAEAEQLHVEWGQYLLEQSALSAYSRIEKEAVEKMGMKVPAGDQLVMVQK